MENNKMIILGSGITGLSAGLNSKREIYESSSVPGGICASYYVNSDGKKLCSRANEESYRFETGGGHWIFGVDEKILNFISSLTRVKTYERNSAVYFSDWELYVPYPLQNHLSYLPKDIAGRALEEIKKSTKKSVSTLADWLELNFGKTLCKIFFSPFHELYTVGLYTKIAPQDKFKSPINKGLIMKGANEKTPAVGYNATFVYPETGLDDLIRKMAAECRVNYNKRIEKIDIKKKDVLFEDGSGVKYESVISTLPLNKVIQMAEIQLDELSATYTSVLVVNIGAKKGEKCPDYHWLYIPQSKSGFHRVGFYSNVDSSFLPISSRKDNDRVSVYVEKAYKSGDKPKNEQIRKLCNDVVKELKNWGFITEAEVVDPTWIDVAYTWQCPDSNWREKAFKVLRENQIYQIGRYGKWKFQGIAESIRDGMMLKML